MSVDPHTDLPEYMMFVWQGGGCVRRHPADQPDRLPAGGAPAQAGESLHLQVREQGHSQCVAEPEPSPE